MIAETEYLKRDPAPSGRLLAYLIAAEAERDSADDQDVREDLAAYVVRLQDQIDEGELTDVESARYQMIQEAADAAGTPVRAFVAAHLKAAGKAVDVDDIVAAYAGRPLTESHRTHARIRQVISRMAWPRQYRLDGPATVVVELSADRVFGRVVWIGASS